MQIRVTHSELNLELPRKEQASWRGAWCAPSLYRGRADEYGALRLRTVEKFHARGHVGTFCAENCMPELFPEVKNFNTVICEERFKWFGKFKGLTLTNMSAATFNFMLLLITWLDHEQRASPYYTNV